MRRLLFAALLLAAAAADAQVNDTYVVPAAGNLPGASGTQWKTQLSLFNPQTYALKISVTLLPTGGANGQSVLINVPANSGALYDNALADLFHYQGGGALLAATFPEDNPTVPNDVVSRSFLVNSETYNSTSSGTYGQTIPGTWATWLGDYATDGISAIAHGIRNTNGPGWRTNIGAVNLGRNNVLMRLTLYDYNGNTVVKDLPFNLPPLAHFQDRLPIALDRGSIEFFVDDPTHDAKVFPYVSSVDQLSGDPKYQTPVLLAGASTIFGKKAVTTERKLTIDDARRVRGAIADYNAPR